MDRIEWTTRVATRATSFDCEWLSTTPTTRSWGWCQRTCLSQGWRLSSVPRVRVGFGPLPQWLRVRQRRHAPGHPRPLATRFGQRPRHPPRRETSRRPPVRPAEQSAGGRSAVAVPGGFFVPSAGHALAVARPLLPPSPLLHDELVGGLGRKQLTQGPWAGCPRQCPWNGFLESVDHGPVCQPKSAEPHSPQSHIGSRPIQSLGGLWKPFEHALSC